MREIIFDTETTGLDADGGDRICEIGAVELDGRMPTGRTFHRLINPERDMPAEATRVHGHTNETLAGQPRFADVVQEWLDFIGEDTALVAHNAGFDVAFVNAELIRCGRARLRGDRIVDTIMLAKRKFPGAKLSLDALCGRFGIDLSRRTKHGALLDAELLASVYVELLGGRQRGMDLVPEPVGQGATVAAVVRTAVADWPVRHFAVPKVEAERHRIFVRALRNPIWDRYADPVIS